MTFRGSSPVENRMRGGEARSCSSVTSSPEPKQLNSEPKQPARQPAKVAVAGNGLAALDKAANWLSKSEDVDTRAVGAAIREWIGGGARQPLAKALHLQSHGGLSVGRHLALADRNRMLTALHRALWPDLAPAAAAGALLRSFSAYEANRWPRDQHRLEAPATEPAATWWRICRLGSMPKARRLRSILADRGNSRPHLDCPPAQ
ncbi:MULTISPECIES: hypothetical protein [unclassified Mesorhizobium]|uniref:hypothetical protein n=1 Tax=unclassified Mesorhizobium TaxID=325217 RepID=UPI001092CBD1|nr:MULTISPECIES: hypothetical protein [unclassified Mesorhizobium]TGQ01417.1 hypothetical protein EN861_01490 [Mesorhizobium sp. M8A.F.Ca.ET.218.01.1.1]TGT20690.1 hypothetical protein EN856_01495 [Mesorhizobium sp. M8A.F.Ca.ET.213.01.1.1]